MHVAGSFARKREFFLSNESNVSAKWKLFHVAVDKKHAAANAGRRSPQELDEANALDDPQAFQFDICEGEQVGPSIARILPLCPAPLMLPHEDEYRYHPTRVTVTFAPRKNEVYKCRFRLQVENGKAVDFVCRGTGSYDEEDDIMEMVEA